MSADDLAIPDPRTQTVPTGWWETYAMPVIAAAETFDELDELQWRVQAVADYLDVIRIDRLEFEAALRLIEVRRGELLGGGRRGRRPRNLPRVEDSTESSAATLHRWRTLAAHVNDVVLPAIREADSYRQLSQARLLRLCDDDGPGPAPALCSCPRCGRVHKRA